MKERPILFQGAMVRAILGGTKTQTRRAVKGIALDWLAPGMFTPEFVADPENHLCPYGHPSDRLWVREAFMHSPAEYEPTLSMTHASRPAETAYRADYPDSQPGEGWKPSIHMPRHLCRLELEVTSVRVERLQDISTRDCWAEGIASSPDVDPRHEYEELWETINGAGSWQANPWVWVVEFRRAEP